MALRTWRIMRNTAAVSAGLTTANTYDTAEVALIQMSTAQQKLQEISSIVRRTATVAVTANTFEYDRPADTKTPITASLLMTGQTSPVPVTIVPPEVVEAFRNGYQNAGRPQPIVADRVQYTGYVMTMEQGKLIIFPGTATGTLSVKYIAFCVPYDPLMLTGQWVDYTSDPTAKMNTDGPYDEFNACLDGIVAYYTMFLLESVPGGVERFKTRYHRANQAWEEAKQAAVWSVPILSKSMRPQLENSPLR